MKNHMLGIALLIFGLPSARSEECGCPAYTWELDQGDCEYTTQCVYVPNTDPNAVEITQESPPVFVVKAEQICDFCDTPYGTHSCGITQSISHLESATVSYAGMFELAVRGDINVALAGKVGIEMTASFRTGEVSQTSITYATTSECSGSLPGCTKTKYKHGVWRRNVNARIPVTPTWQWKYTGGGPQGCTESGWVTLDECLDDLQYNTISGDDFLVFECVTKNLGECCTEACPCCTDEYPEN